MSYISSLEVHQLVQSVNLEALASGDVDVGPLVLETLGILEWSSIYHVAEKGGILKALSQVCQYIGMLPSFESHDRLEFDRASSTTQKIVIALTLERVVSPLSSNSLETASSSSPLDIASIVHQNPLIKMEFLSETEKARVQTIIDAAQHAQHQVLNPLSEEDLFVSIIPLRCMELEVATVDNMMWHIPSINNPPPISIIMWAQWTGFSTEDLKICRQHAIDGTFFSKIHILSEKWAMSMFATPSSGKY